MRLWYQSLGRLDAWGGYPTALSALITAAAPGIAVRLEGTGRGVAEHHHATAQAAAGDVLDAVRAAVAEGVDALVIGNFFDIGLDAAREIAPFPVLGLGQTSLHLAAQMGASFGLVAPNEKYAARLLEGVRRHGLEGRLAGIAALDLPRIRRLSAAFDDEAARADFLDAVAVAVERELGRAEVIVPAGGVLMALLWRAGVTCTPRGAPILNGIAGLVGMAEVAVRLARLHEGGFVSRRATWARPSAEEAEEIRRFYGPIYPA
ncbi:aspartate/glutamate racemase family protein [Salinarimonas sp. NSM]|uniref:aspartate/glutamate racemase family protein n=1 Tax=Salinarimonas sp. NSM TaxID=3458003 RepID=UPI004035D919